MISEKYMVRYMMLEVHPETTLKAVEIQPFFRGDLILCEDARRQYLLISQSMPGIARALDEVCGQTVSETSLYESARRQLRRGRTGGCWSVLRLPCTEAIAHYNEQRAKYKQCVVAAWRPSAWIFE